MKILNLKFQNLNSLVGKWEIDFKKASGDGIFAITGPTGAGKTTILDALCLALYGRTPRLSSVTKSKNEIMSRGTGECLSEVEFETAKGTFVCRFSQRRSKGSPEGDLQQPLQEIWDPLTGKILESKIKDVALKVEEVTSMDFKAFTKSVMLAQGAFSSFLRASPSERAPILEDITGSEIYTEISIGVHERYKKEKDKLLGLKEDLKGIFFLGDDEEHRLSEELEDLESKETGLLSQIKDSQGALDRLWNLKSMEKELEDAESQSLRLMEEKKALEPKAERLAFGKKASVLVGIYERYKGLKESQSRDKGDLDLKKNSLPKLQNLKDEKDRALENSEGLLLKLKEDLGRKEITFKEVRRLDQALNSLKENLINQSKKLKDLENEGKNTRKVLEKALSQEKEAEKNMDIRKRDLSLAKKELLGLLSGRTIGEYRQEKEFVIKERAYQDRIASLEDQRKQLQDGKPCPLCGAKDHPYAKGALPKPQDKKREEELTNLIQKAEALEENIRHLEMEFQEALRNRDFSRACGEKQRALLEKHRDYYRSLLKELKDLEARRDGLQAERKGIFGEKDPNAEEKELKELLISAEKTSESQKQGREALSLDLKALRTQIETLEQAMDQRQGELSLWEDKFKQGLESQGFEDERAFEASIMDPKEMDVLEKTLGAIERKEVELGAKKEEKRIRLEAERKKAPGLSEDELKLKLFENERSLSEVRKLSGKIRADLEDNGRSKRRFQEKLKEISSQEKEARRFEVLHGLIGSSDGKKYRNFAQTLTFQTLVSRANAQLSRMSDRYVLVLDKDKALELAVLDNYRMGDVRSTENLSGGESFIVSLALALGLSQMAGKNGRVDSLFLDEGFGTLDQESMDMALDTLGELKQEGKVIGIISHLPAIQDRIGSKITVTPEKLGRSVITGPGCRRV